MTEYQKAVSARFWRMHYKAVADVQKDKLTFKPSDFHNLPCKPMRMKRWVV